MDEFDSPVEDPLIGDLRAVLGTPAGRRVLWRVLTDSHMCALFDLSPLHADGMLEGRRAAGLQLMAYIETASFDSWLKMQLEAHSERRAGSE